MNEYPTYKLLEGEPRIQLGFWPVPLEKALEMARIDERFDPVRHMRMGFRPWRAGETKPGAAYIGTFDPIAGSDYGYVRSPRVEPERVNWDEMQKTPWWEYFTWAALEKEHAGVLRIHWDSSVVYLGERNWANERLRSLGYALRSC